VEEEENGGEGESLAVGKGQLSSEARADSEARVHVPFIDDRRPRSELKAGRRQLAKRSKEEARRRTGAEAEAERMFEDVLEDLRQAHPLILEGGGLVVWSRKAAVTACKAVGLTAEVVQEGTEDEVGQLAAAAFNWLEANKPKHRARVRERSASGSRRQGGAEGAIEDTGRGTGDHNDSALVDAEVEGEEDGGVGSNGDGESGQGDDAANGGGGKDGSGEAGAEASGEDLLSGPAQKRVRRWECEGLGGREGRRERREEQTRQRAAARQRASEQKQAERAHIPAPSSVGRVSAAGELEAHRRATRKREKARAEARELVGEAR
jgi:hypothetical protein